MKHEDCNAIRWFLIRPKLGLGKRILGSNGMAIAKEFSAHKGAQNASALVALNAMEQFAKISIGLLLAASLIGCSKGEDTSGDKGANKKGAASTALVAETESEKAWLAWQVAACKCKDFACASASASARIPIEKKYPDSISAKEKNIGKIIKAANACLTKAMEPPTPKQP